MTLKLVEDLNRRALERGLAQFQRQMASIVFLSTALGNPRRYSDRSQPARFPHPLGLDNPPHGGALSSPRPGSVRDNRCGHEVHEGRRQTVRQSAYAGSRLKLIYALGRSRLISQPSSRTGENPLSGCCDQVRLVCSAGDRPARARVRSPVVWMAG